MMTEDLEKPYHELLRKAEYDEKSQRRVALLNQTLDAFGVVMNRTQVAGTIIALDNACEDILRAYIDMEDPRNDGMVRMLTHFKQLQSRVVENTVDNPEKV